jgi:hypothetical protein
MFGHFPDSLLRLKLLHCISLYGLSLDCFGIPGFAAQAFRLPAKSFEDLFAFQALVIPGKDSLSAA